MKPGKMIIVFFILVLSVSAQKSNYIKIIKKYAAEMNIPYKIAIGIAMKENPDFNPSVVNYKQAVGLLQVRPIAFRQFCLITGKTAYTNTRKFPDQYFITRLKNADENIYIGLWYLKYLYSLNNDNWIIALSHYNTGPNAELYNFDYVNDVILNGLNY